MDVTVRREISHSPENGAINPETRQIIVALARYIRSGKGDEQALRDCLSANQEKQAFIVSTALARAQKIINRHETIFK